jgi:Protein of unknown function (DUF2752)
MNAGILLRQQWLQIPRWKDAVIPASILTACFIASASPNSVSLFGFRVPNACPFKAFTGLDCPGCGITRAMILAAHGRWLDSYYMHLWGIPLLMFFLWRIFSAISGRHFPTLLPTALQPWKTRFIALSLIVPWIMKSVALLLLH